MKSGQMVIVVLLIAVFPVLVINTHAIAIDEDNIIEVHYFTWATGMSERYIEEDLIAPFEAMHPNIKIIHEPVSGNEFWDKLPTMIAAGISPDLIHMSVGYVHEYAQKGLLENLQPYFDRDLDMDNFFSQPMKAMRYPNQEHGDLYGMP